MTMTTSSSSSTSSRTITLQFQQPIISDSRLEVDESVTLTLAPRLKKKVSWQPGTVDNEFLDRKSSKECCIFHEEQEIDSCDD